MQRTLPRLAIIGTAFFMLVVRTKAIPVKRQSPERELLIDDWPSANGTVGRQDPQTFRFDFDTGEESTSIPQSPQLNHLGSGKTWVASYTPGNVGGYKFGGTPLYRSTGVQYLDGTKIWGPIYEDDLTIAGLTAKDLQLIVTDRANEDDTFAMNNGPDALIGMSYVTRSSSSHNSTGFFETLILQKDVDVSEFGFFFGRPGETSWLTLGGRDHSKYKGEIVTALVLRQGDWPIKVDSISVRNYTFTSNGGFDCMSLPQLYEPTDR